MQIQGVITGDIVYYTNRLFTHTQANFCFFIPFYQTLEKRRK